MDERTRLNVVQVPRRFVRSEWGGTETVILETSRALQMRGHATEILCPNALATSNLEEIEGIRVQRTGYFHPYLGLSAEAKRQLDLTGGNIFSFSLMRELARRKDLDLIHMHTGKRIGGIGRWAAQRLGIPYVVSVHGGAFDVPTEEAARWTEPTKGALEWGKALGMWVGSRRVFDDAGAILCVGDSERIAMQKQYPDQRVEFLPNGVDPERFGSGDREGFRSEHGIDQDAEVILCVGRIDPQKNQVFLVELLPRLLEQRPKAHLLLVGHVTNDDYHAKLEASIARLGLDDRVTRIEGVDPKSPALANAYHAADVFALPSLHEPFGIVILEAWAAGLPVVASRVGGIPSFVEDGVDGLLVPASDEKETALALEALLASSARREEMALAAARKVAETYSWSRIADRLETLYGEVIDAHSLR